MQVAHPHPPNLARCFRYQRPKLIQIFGVACVREHETRTSGEELHLLNSAHAAAALDVRAKDDEGCAHSGGVGDADGENNVGSVSDDKDGAIVSELVRQVLEVAAHLSQKVL